MVVLSVISLVTLLDFIPTPRHIHIKTYSVAWCRILNIKLAIKTFFIAFRFLYYAIYLQWFYEKCWKMLFLLQPDNCDKGPNLAHGLLFADLWPINCLQCLYFWNSMIVTLFLMRECMIWDGMWEEARWEACTQFKKQTPCTCTCIRRHTYMVSLNPTAHRKHQLDNQRKHLSLLLFLSLPPSLGGLSLFLS